MKFTPCMPRARLQVSPPPIMLQPQIGLLLMAGRPKRSIQIPVRASILSIPTRTVMVLMTVGNITSGTMRSSALSLMACGRGLKVVATLRWLRRPVSKSPLMRLWLHSIRRSHAGAKVRSVLISTMTASPILRNWSLVRIRATGIPMATVRRIFGRS